MTLLFFRRRWIAGTLLVTCLITSARATAPAFEAETPGEHAANRSNRVDENLELYLEAFRSGRNWESAIYRSRIQRLIFAAETKDDYGFWLRQIDRRAAKDPQAIHSLSLYLQRHWETRYASANSCTATGTFTAASQLGALAGVGALSAALFYQPQHAARYFRIFRHLLPLAGLHGGRALGARMEPSSPIPPAPAQIMRLGMPHDFQRTNEAFLIDETRRLMLALAAGSVSYAAVSASVLRMVKLTERLSKAATPMKVNLVILAGSVALGYAAERGIQEGIDRRERSSRLARLRGARARIDQALSAQEPELAYEAANDFSAATIDLARYLNQPVIERIQDFDREFQQLQADYGRTAQGRAKLDRLARDFEKDLVKIRRDLDRRAGSDATQQVEAFLAHPTADSARRMAEDLRSGIMPMHPDFVLLQSTAYLKALEHPSFEGHAELLLSVLNSQRALRCESGVGAATDALMQEAP